MDAAFFFFNDTATTEIYTLSLHDALPISLSTYRQTAPRSSRSPTDRSSTTLTACPPSSTRDFMKAVPKKPHPPVINQFKTVSPRASSKPPLRLAPHRQTSCAPPRPPYRRGRSPVSGCSILGTQLLTENPRWCSFSPARSIVAQ